MSEIRDMNGLMEADMAAGSLLGSVNGPAQSGNINNREAEEKITDYAQRNEQAYMYEYLVRGADLICDKGSHIRKINLPKCHGVYVGEFPLLHELECVSECQSGIGKCNITFFGVCEANPPTETKAYTKTVQNSKDGTAGQVIGCKCEPCIVGCWNGCYGKTRIVDNGIKNPEDRSNPTGIYTGQSTLTTESFLVCKYGGIIQPINSGQYIG